MKKLFSYPVPISFIAGLLLLTPILGPIGCRSFGPFASEKPKKVFSLHEIATHDLGADRLQGQFPTGQNGEEQMRVRLFPLLHSRHITGMEVISGYTTPIAMRLYLTDRGSRLWLQIQSEHRGRPLAVTVDGEILFVWNVPALPGQREIVIDGPWDRQQAQEIAGQARNNFLLLHK